MTFQSQQTISVKALNTDTNDVRRFSLPLDGSLAALQQKLTVFGAPHGDFKVFWHDDQNDKVTLATDDDLRYAVEETMPALLRLAVSAAKDGETELEGWQADGLDGAEPMLEWDDELAMLQAQGMPFDEAVARMRARAHGESELPFLTKEQVSALSDDTIFQLARPMLDDGAPLDEAIAHAALRAAADIEAVADINGGEDEDVAIKLVSATHRIRAMDASSRSEGFTVLADDHNLCYVEGPNGFAEFTIGGADKQVHDRRLTELLIKYASAEPRPLRLLVDGELRGEVCVHETQGFGHADLEWRTHAPFELDLAATHVVRLETDGFFPHLMELALVPTEVSDLDQEFNVAQAAKGSSRAVIHAVGSFVSGFVNGVDGLVHAVVEAVDPSSDEDEHERWAAQQQSKRERRRERRAAARREAEQRLALARRWSKFLPHARDGAPPVLIDGSAIANGLRSNGDSDRQSQMRVLDHVRSSAPITQLSFRVVFEGAPGKWAKKWSADNIELIFTYDRPSVDELCEQAAAGSLVVTCDRLVALAVLEVGAQVMKANRFYTLTDTDSEDSSESESESGSDSGSSSEESEDEYEDERPRRSQGFRRNHRH